MGAEEAAAKFSRWTTGPFRVLPTTGPSRAATPPSTPFRHSLNVWGGAREIFR